MIPYKVKFASSEEDECPASLLTSNTNGGRGWKSRRFCTYPQELVLLLDHDTQISQIQLLSHHSCISTKVELYSASGVNDSSSVADWTFSRIGYFTLDDNSRSEYRARELKTVYVNVQTRALRIVLHKNYVNSHNRFNQVGISAIAVQGTPESKTIPDAVNRARIAPLNTQKNIPNNVSGILSTPAAGDIANDLRMSSLDSQTRQRIKDLEMLKSRAISAEDFDEAKRCKEESEKLFNAGIALSKLEEQKKIAVAGDDFDLAKQIKLEIERIRAVAAGTLDGDIDPNAPLPPSDTANRGTVARAAPTRQTPLSRPTQQPPVPSVAPRMTAPAPPSQPKMNSNHGENSTLPSNGSGYDLSSFELPSTASVPVSSGMRGKSMKKPDATSAAAPKRLPATNQVVTTLATDNVELNVCMFCHLESEDFENVENLEVHLHRECPTVAECPGCNQMIEVVDMIKHRNEECPEAQIFAPCNSCQLPITDEEAETDLHLSCSPPLGSDSRGQKMIQCILCTKELPSNSAARWRRHLSRECTENIRRTGNM